MVLSEIRTEILSIENNSILFEEINFLKRTDAIDYLDFHIIDRMDHLLMEADPPEELSVLQLQALKLKHRFEIINADLFLRIRTNIQSGTCKGSSLKFEIAKYLSNSSDKEQQPDEIGYDNLDLMINGVFPVQDTPIESKRREPEMIFYQKTPARIIFELVEKARFREADVFYDLGSGLGQVVILVNLLSGIRSSGVEFEPEFCNYAKKCAAELNLINIKFINADARSLNYSDGTVFFMYTPFVGSILQEMLEILYKESKMRVIRIFTYGPCTHYIAQQNWLISVGDRADTNKLGEFTSARILSRK